MQFERKRGLKNVAVFFLFHTYTQNLRSIGALSVPVSLVATYGCRAM